MVDTKSGVLLPGLVVVEHDLGVVWRKDLLPRHVLVQLYVRVHVYHLPIPLVAEEQPRLPAPRVHLEVGTVVGGADSGLPVVVAEVGGLGQQLHLALEDGLEVLGLEAVGVVDVAGNLLLLARHLHPQEDDREPPPVEDFLLALCEEVEEGVGLSRGGST